MTSKRNYRIALSEEEAINEIRRCSGSQFDPEIAKVFIDKILKKSILKNDFIVIHIKLIFYLY